MEEPGLTREALEETKRSGALALARVERSRGTVPKERMLETGTEERLESREIRWSHLRQLRKETSQVRCGRLSDGAAEPGPREDPVLEEEARSSVPQVHERSHPGFGEEGCHTEGEGRVRLRRELRHARAAPQPALDHDPEAGTSELLPGLEPGRDSKT